MCAAGTPYDNCPPLAPADVVKLHAALTLSICSVLDAAGAMDSRNVAKLLTGHILGKEHEPWAMVAGAIARSLDALKAGAPGEGGPLEGGRLSVIAGNEP